MIIALFVAAVVVSMPLVAIVVVTIASRREDAALSLGRPADGMVQMAARRLLGFHSEAGQPPAWAHADRHAETRCAIEGQHQDRRVKHRGGPDVSQNQLGTPDIHRRGRPGAFRGER
jgi:hypothetical protein